MKELYKKTNSLEKFIPGTLLFNEDRKGSKTFALVCNKDQDYYIFMINCKYLKLKLGNLKSVASYYVLYKV